MCTIGYSKKLNVLFKNRDKNVPTDEVILVRSNIIATKTEGLNYFSLGTNRHGCAFVSAAVNTPQWTALASKGKKEEAAIQFKKENEGLSNPIITVSEYLPEVKTAEEWLEKLPGPYTLILKLKNPEAVEHIVNKGMATIGVRIPDHWTTDIAKELNLPIVTTSANLAGKAFMTSVETLDTNVRNKVAFMINEGEIKGKPSTLVNLTKDEVEVKERK